MQSVASWHLEACQRLGGDTWPTQKGRQVFSKLRGSFRSKPRSFGPCSLLSRACMKEIGTSDFSKQKSHQHHNSCDSSQGHHQSWAQGLRAGSCYWVAMDSTEWGRWRHWHRIGYSAGCFHLWGVVSTQWALLSSEPSFSFLFLELLGSGCPVCEETCRTIVKLFFTLFLVLFPFAAPLCNYALYFVTFVLGGRLWLFNLGVGCGLQMKEIFTWIFLISVDWGRGVLVLGSYKLYPKAKSKC